MVIQNQKKRSKKIPKEKQNSNTRGSAGQYYVAGELSRRGLVAVITQGNTLFTDILCSNLQANRFLHIQVKTFSPEKGTCTLGEKAENPIGENFFWVLAGIPTPRSQLPFEYFIIPSMELAAQVKKSHQLWLATPGKGGVPHKQTTMRNIFTNRKLNTGWDIQIYKNRWDLIEDRLKP